MPRPFEPKARLGWQQEGGEFSYESHDGPNRISAGELVDHLTSMGHLEAIDGAQVQAFVMLAEAVDSDPTNASLWREYRAAELQIRGVTDRGKESAFDALIKELADSDAAVPDASVVKSSDARGAGRKGVSRPRATTDATSTVDRRPRRGTAA